MAHHMMDGLTDFGTSWSYEGLNKNKDAYRYQFFKMTFHGPKNGDSNNEPHIPACHSLPFMGSY
jgi:hypothetical protein